MASPVFISITSTGQIWVSNDVTFNPSGTIVKQFRVNPNATNQKICTLTGSGNSSSSALSCTVATVSGKAEGNEVH